MNTALLPGFYLGERLIDPVRGEVTTSDGSAHLPSKAMEVLLCLASQPGELVTRKELIENVWGPGNASDETLNHAVSDIRHALRDHADDPVYIQTLPKRGYRLIVDVVPLEESSRLIGGATAAHITGFGWFEALNRRGVLETGVAYLVLGWLIIQIADIVFAQLLFPQWMGTFVTVLVIAGFPLALILSWFLEFRDGRAVIDTPAPQVAMRRRFGRTYLAIIGALAISGVLVLLYDRNLGLPKSQRPAAEARVLLPPITDNSFAVLPFMNVDGSDETDIFVKGLTDDLISRLSRVPGLLVSARGDSILLNPNTPSGRVRERLRVARYLEGSVQMTSEGLRIIVQLIDSRTGKHLQSRTFDRSRGDFFEVRDEITELMVANVRVALPPDTQAASQMAGKDPSIDAYILYRRGIDASRLPVTVENIETALGWFDRSLEIDPEFSAAHAGKCQVFVGAYAETNDATFIDRAQNACANALHLNPNLDIVHTALGDLHRATGLYQASERAYQAALEFNPQSAEALIGIGKTYRLQQKTEEAEASLRMAIGLHPGSWRAYNELGSFLYRSGRYEDAAREFERVTLIDPGNVRGMGNTGAARMLAGDFEAAAVALQSALDIEARSNTYSNLGLVYYYLGRMDESVSNHRHAVRLSPDDRLFWSNLGDALWHAGRIDEAREVFGTAAGLGRSALVVNPNDGAASMDLAWIMAMLNEADEARALIDRALMLVPDDPYVHYIDGLIRLRQDQTDLALAALEKALNMGYPVQIMAAEPHLRGLADNREFQRLVNAG